MAAQRHGGGVQPGMVAFVDGGTVAGGQIDRVEQVLDADRQAMQRAAQGAAIQGFRVIQGGLLLQRRPGMDGVFALLDARKAGSHQLHRGQFAPLQLARRFKRAKSV